MDNSLQIMQEEIVSILEGNKPTIYLLGSTVLGDFKLGWSDIDFLVLCEEEISQKQADSLVNLRQRLALKYPNESYFSFFEGSFLTWGTLLKNEKKRLVYWGTTGQRINTQYESDVFTIMDLKNHGKLIHGLDKRDKISHPERVEIVAAIEEQYQIIRKYAIKPSRAVTSAGWLLTIARCLYTLENNQLVSKTESGKWALKKRLVPNEEVMRKAVEIRKCPNVAKVNESVLDWCENLGPYIQEFANVLECHLSNEHKEKG